MGTYNFEHEGVTYKLKAAPATSLCEGCAIYDMCISATKTERKIGRGCVGVIHKLADKATEHKLTLFAIKQRLMS